MTASKILLRNIYHLYTGAAGDNRKRGVDLLVSEGKIAAIGQNLAAADAEIIDASTKLVMPGLVNTHHHMYQTMQRNIPAVQDAKLFDWLVALYEIWKYLDAEVVYIGTKLACAELLKSGCTTASDHHYVFPEGVKEDLMEAQFRAASELGIRFLATRGSMSRGRSKGGLPPDSVVQDEQTILRDCEEQIKKWHDTRPFSMRHLALAPCSPFSVSGELLKLSAELARKYGVRLHTHLAETKDEEEYCLKVYGARPLQMMADYGWVGPDVWYAHGVHFNDEELALLARTQTGIAHCPSSNMRLGSGIARVPEMLKLNIPVGLAVDGSASNDSSDMIGELRSCLLTHRVLGGANAITAEQVVRLATRGSASLLGWPEIGELSVGKAADIVLVEMNRLDYAGALSDPLAAIVFSGMSHNVHTVLVNGRIVVRDGQLPGVDEEALQRRANQLAKMMMDKAGHDTKWYL